MSSYKFKKVPANFRQVRVSAISKVLPSDIYNYAKSFRSVYTRSMPLLKPIADPSWGGTHNDVKQFYEGKAQALATQIAFSNELLLKAILLGSTGEFVATHNLRQLFNCLDSRYQDIIGQYLEDNGLKKDKLKKVLDVSANTFVNARYGFDKNHTLDFMTLQLLNEVLDIIFNNYTPDWTKLTDIQQQSQEKIKELVDLVFDPKNQKEIAEQNRLSRLLGRELNKLNK